MGLKFFFTKRSIKNFKIGRIAAKKVAYHRRSYFSQNFKVHFHSLTSASPRLRKRMFFFDHNTKKLFEKDETKKKLENEKSGRLD